MRSGASGMRQTSEILKIQFFIGSRSLGKIFHYQLLSNASVFLIFQIKHPVILYAVSLIISSDKITKETFRFNDETKNHTWIKRRNLEQAWQVWDRLTGRNSAFAIKGYIASCQNSSCTQDFTWIHDVHAVNLHKSQYHTEKRLHTSKQLNMHVQNDAQKSYD